MNWIATVIGIIIIVPLAIFLIRRFIGIIAIALGVVGILALFAKQYVGGIILIAVALLLTKIIPPDDGTALF